jgi:hypothetical protein
MEDIESIRSNNLYPKKKGSNAAKLAILLVLILAFIGAIAYGGMQFLGQQDSADTTPSPTPTAYLFPTDPPTPTEASASPTLSVKISPTTTSKTTPTLTTKVASDTTDKTTGLDRKTLTIEVLNGSGTAGAGKKAADILTGLGYKVVSTGNADSYDYATTEVSVKSTKKNFLTLLEKDLSASYTVEADSAALTASASADARVIVGKK